MSQQILKISKVLANPARLAMIIGAKAINAPYFRAANIINKEVLGADFDKIKEGKNMQAHFFRIVKAGIFVAGKKGCYTLNSELLKEYSQLVESI